MGSTASANRPVLIAPYYPEGRNGRPPFALETMLRVHFMQQWFGLSDPAMEEAFFDVPLYREFAQLEAFGRLPDESTILRFRHRLQEHKLAEQILATVNELLSSKGLLLKVGTAVDATLIAAPTSTKNKEHGTDPEMHSSQKGKQWYFGMKAHIGVDADSGLVHTVRTTSGNVHDIVEANSLLHGQEQMVFADAGYQGIEKRPDTKPDVKWHVAMRPGKRKALNKQDAADALIDAAEKIKAGVRAKVEHPFRVIKRQFGHLKTRYRGLKKNTQQLMTLFALSNLWMMRSNLMGEKAWGACKQAKRPEKGESGPDGREKQCQFMPACKKYWIAKNTCPLPHLFVSCSVHPLLVKYAHSPINTG